MIYKITNAGFEAVMSNSSAFYFDMAKDYDFESLGLSWSGYIDYKDTWGTEPFNVFSNMQTLRKNDYLDESKILNDYNSVNLNEILKNDFFIEHLPLLYCVGAGFTGPHANCLLNIKNKNFPITDLSSVCRLFYRLNNFIGHRLFNNDF